MLARASALPISASGCACGAIACADSVYLRAQIMATTYAMADATVELCMNGACAAGTLGSDSTQQIELVGSDFRAGAAVVADGSDTVILEFSPTLCVVGDIPCGGPTGPPEECCRNPSFQDGDVYSVSAALSDGTPLVAEERTVTYGHIEDGYCGGDCIMLAEQL